MNPHLAEIDPIRNKPYGPDLERALEQVHVNTLEKVFSGRNVTAGYIRGWGLADIEGIAAAIEQDPIYKESKELADGLTVVTEHKLMNLFMIMKYGCQNMEGDIVEFGSYKGGSAIFMANVARRLGMKTQVFALDTFEGMPETDANRDLHSLGDFNDASIDTLRVFAAEHQLFNLIPVQGLFEDTAPSVLERIPAVTLAHIDCDIYSAVKFAIDVVRPKMHESGGYLAFDDPLQATCIGAMEAVEEMVQETGLHAEQVYPHLVYRYPAPHIDDISVLTKRWRSKDEELRLVAEQLSSQQEQLRDRDEIIGKLQKELSEMYASTSWRCTLPLRKLKMAFSGK